jgi:hypothetical protein
VDRGRARGARRAPPRRHEDTDVAIRAGDLEAVRRVMGGWHLWEAVDGALRPLLYKARLDRPKDRADLLAARLDPAGRAWLAGTLERLGYDAWARLARQ